MNNGWKKKNRYKVKTSGLVIEESISADWCKGKSDDEIIVKILIIHSFFNVLQSFNEGRRTIKLVPIRVHEESAK